MDLEEDFDFRDGFSDRIVRGVDDDSNSGLGNPSEGLGQEVVQAVEVGSDKAEGVADRAGVAKGMLDLALALSDCRVGLEPGALEVLGLGDGAAEGGGEGPGLGPVVGSMNAGFGAGVVGLVFAVRASAAAEDRLGVDAVDLGATPGSMVAEGLLKGLVVSVPRYDLGVGTSKVYVEQDVAGVRKKELPDVGEGDAGTETHSSLHWILNSRSSRPAQNPIGARRKSVVELSKT